MQSIYSFYGSRLHLILEDKLAEAYNRRIEQWYEAQEHHLKVTGKKWDPKDLPLLLMRKDDEAQDAYDKVGSVIRLLVEINGGGLDLPEEECTSDYLVKL